MFRRTDAQSNLFPAGGLPPEKQAACEKNWAGAFRREAFPILLRAEPKFADMFNQEHGRPSRSVALMLGVLILKDVKDLTDEETVAALDFDVRWWYAFDGVPEQMHLCEKTLRNFRGRLMAHAKGEILFRQVSDELIAALGVKVEMQRLDSTHILSNFAVLNRLGLMCETIRLFLCALSKEHRPLYERIEVGVLKRHGDEYRYADARRGEGPRRLEVTARDVYRLVERFKGDRAVSQMDEFKLLARLYGEQCEVQDKPANPKEGDDDSGDGPVPVKLKDAKKVGSSSLQTPHDPDVTYSGHKGKGYSLQIVETCVKGNPVQMITAVKTTPAAQSDHKSTIPMIDALSKAKHKPDELAADTNYSGAKNAAEAAERGVNLLAPCPAKGKPEPGKQYAAPAEKCPTDQKATGEWLKAQEAQPEFKERYAIRAGIEATNSEYKRAHGGGNLRVRGGKRVELASYLKAAACNLKRALQYWLMEPGLAVEGAVSLA
jgi:hypothetical protein